MGFLVDIGLLFMKRLGRNNERPLGLLRYFLEKVLPNAGKMQEFQIKTIVFGVFEAIGDIDNLFDILRRTWEWGNQLAQRL